MEFYAAQYKKQRYNREKDVWEDTCYSCQRIVVVAESWGEAVSKLNVCLSKVETGINRAIPVGDVVACIGLDLRQEFDNGFSVRPVK